MFPPKRGAAVKSRAYSPEKVIVAVKAEKLISKTAMAWALAHVAHPGDCILLLAVFSDGEERGRKLWRLPKWKVDCRRDNRQNLLDRICQISESCSQMVLQFHDHFEVVVRIKVVSDMPAGAVAAEAKSNQANWVILDKKLKQQCKYCMEELHCNIVVMKGSKPKVLRLNLGCSDDLRTPFISAPCSPGMDVQGGVIQDHRIKYSTPVSSPEESSMSYTQSVEENLVSSTTDTSSSVFIIYQQNPLFESLIRGREGSTDEANGSVELLPAVDSCGERLVTLSKTPKSSARSNTNSGFWIPQTHIVGDKSLTSINSRTIPKTKLSTAMSLNEGARTGGPVLNQTFNRNSIFSANIREAVSFAKTSSVAPPLCSLCQDQAPAFGKPLRQFCYIELYEATDGFSGSNFLADGGVWLVHRGLLKDGLVVAIKHLKFSGSQGDADFCKEVRVLSCAQHKNVVLLVGFCIEGNRRILVYEYVCNESLDVHLHGKSKMPLDWKSRLKIALGTATGLRYLHEDCRVGCIVHRDMRPKNILLTHDFEPLVSDFGLVSLLAEWDICHEQRVIGTSGYLAPEYFDGGNITEKVDIYAFGLVLLELITRRRTSELQCYGSKNLLLEILQPVAALEPVHILAYKHQLLDPHLGSCQPHNFPEELHALGWAASFCLQMDPKSRPPMSKVLKILEGESRIPLGLDLNSAGSRSGHLQVPVSNTRVEAIRHSRRLSF